MAESDLLADVSRYLLELARDTLCPDPVPARELVSFGTPDAPPTDAQVLLCLYEVHECFEAQLFRNPLAAGGNQTPPLALMLCYAICAASPPHSNAEALLQQRTLGQLFRMVHRADPVPVRRLRTQLNAQDDPIRLSFSRLDLQDKRELWLSFSQPMRPAVYCEVGPLLIDGSELRIDPVREVHLDVQKMEEQEGSGNGNRRR